ncbi:helix-turn-helix domain-containing protein [Pseudoduganella albidiflava]|uniref:DNA-binding protein n=1 Tax=Pseudoduganella albidiflava TaxID=321983 RepID=A0A411WTG6_9BURK|nr:helix-turn-helix domain-containing protein [Pseudoduganella albidiflava]QBH99888.1 DNA-binding protein [Pseudoduganella albidiflava]GGY54635.1 hypothetical protein GCM10007387_41260 [Pseudoduganella albidiflava]
MSQITAETVYKNFTKLPAGERAKFFALLAEPSLLREDFSHEQVFGHLADEEFTAQEAAEYLEVSMSTFRRHVSHGRIKPSGEVGRNQLFSAGDLKAFKRSLREVKKRRSSVA